jgi:hypothetical protein
MHITKAIIALEKGLAMDDDRWGVWLHEYKVYIHILFSNDYFYCEAFLLCSFLLFCFTCNRVYGIAPR